MESERTTDSESKADAKSQSDSESEFRDKYLFAAAEIENTRKRERRRAEEFARAVKKRMLLRFLPVLDNLERAIAHQDSEAVRAGLAATLRGFESALESEGVVPVLTTGLRFDPNVAEAVGTQSAAGVDEETVLAEAQRGYLVDEELLRPALVIVAKNA
jgi:molecular chaperone GrpE